MAHARQQHPNAVLTPTGRRRMMACVIEHRWTIDILGESAAVLVTKGGLEQRRVLRFAKWLASDAAAPFLGAR